MKKFIFLSIALFLFQACTLPDADIEETPAIVAAQWNASTDQLFRMETHVTGTIQIGYTSPMKVSVAFHDGDMLLSQASYDATALSIPVEADLVLNGAGERHLSVTVQYAGEEMRQTLVLPVELRAPQLSLNSWTTDFDLENGMMATNTLHITTEEGYAVDRIRYSVDRGPWVDLPVDGADHTLAIHNPDIGETTVDIEVAARIHGQQVTTRLSDSFVVDPIFDCNNPTQAMLPENDLVSNMNEEHRIMKGYFGNPTGGHVVSFVITANVPGDGIYQSVSNILDYGPTAITAGFYVNPLRCNNEPCNLPYRLEFFLDGIMQCSRDNFGVIYRY